MSLEEQEQHFKAVLKGIAVLTFLMAICGVLGLFSKVFIVGLIGIGMLIEIGIWKQIKTDLIKKEFKKTFGKIEDLEHEKEID